jgi:hypothetical protein
MDRGSFFHEVYRIEQKLGRIYRELEPYALYPLDEYFGGTYKKDLRPESVNVLRMPMLVKRRRSLRPPLKKVA